MTPDVLIIKGLEVTTRIGVYEWEQQVKQRLILDIELVLPRDMVTRAAQSDSVTSALDYVALESRIQSYASQSACQLLETFAEKLAHVLLEEFSTPKLVLQVSKPTALAKASQVAIRIERSRS